MKQSKKPKKWVGKITNIAFQMGNTNAPILADFYNTTIDGQSILKHLIIFPTSKAIYEFFKFMIFCNVGDFLEIRPVSIDCVPLFETAEGVFYKVNRLTLHFE